MTFVLNIIVDLVDNRRIIRGYNDINDNKRPS